MKWFRPKKEHFIVSSGTKYVICKPGLGSFVLHVRSDYNKLMIISKIEPHDNSLLPSKATMVAFQTTFFITFRLSRKFSLLNWKTIACHLESILLWILLMKMMEPLRLILISDILQYLEYSGMFTQIIIPNRNKENTPKLLAWYPDNKNRFLWAFKMLNDSEVEFFK